MRQWISSAGRNMQRQLVAALLRPAELTRPVFIVGCGRSGTTILGRLLAKHPLLAYLNEPRNIWALEPKTDIWSTKAEGRRGQLRLDASDLRPAAAARIERMFAAEVRLQRAERLVEKLPINTFRIEFIAALFPDAHFIHVVRNGVEVASSIAKLADQGGWFSHRDYKWRLLSEYARRRGETELVALCTNNLTRGLLEWHLSVSTALASLSRLPPDRQIEIRSEHLLQTPNEVCERIEAFIGIPPDRAMRTFASAVIGARPSVGGQVSHSPLVRTIAGNLLTRLGYLQMHEQPALDA